MEKKSKMKRWQIATLAILFICAIGIIIIVNIHPGQGKQSEEAQQPATSNTASITTSPAASNVSVSAQPSPLNPSAPADTSANPSPSASADQYSNGVTVTTDGAGNQTVSRDWGGSDPSTKPTSGGAATAAPSTAPSSTTAGTGSSKPSSTSSSSSTSGKSSGGSSSGKSSGGSSSSSGSSTPKNGATKTEDGVDYIYLEGFGWVVDKHGKSVAQPAGTEQTTGVHVGNFG